MLTGYCISFSAIQQNIFLAPAPTATPPATIPLEPTGKYMSDNKRKHERYAALNLSYICEDKDGDVLYEGMGRTMNVSEGGMLLETSCYITPGNHLTLEVALEDALINLRGRVVYCNEQQEKKFYTGLALVEPDVGNQAILDHFIKIFAQQG